MDAVKGVAASLKDWSGNVLGDLEKRVKKVKGELEKCRRRNISRDQVAMEEGVALLAGEIRRTGGCILETACACSMAGEGRQKHSFFPCCMLGEEKGD
jgi:hypothetical protein